jgi:hypothetical protein
MSKLYPSISGLSILMALALALGEWYFFFYGGTWEGPFGFFAPSRLGFNLAWLTLVYLSFQLLSIPLAIGTRQRFISVVDGMASLIPLAIALVVICFSSGSLQRHRRITARKDPHACTE